MSEEVPAPIDPDLRSDISRYTGRRWLAYVGNTDDSTINEWIAGMDDSLDASQLSSLATAVAGVLEVLRNAANTARLNEQSLPFHPNIGHTAINIEHLVGLSGKFEGENFSNFLRVRAGGVTLKDQFTPEGLMPVEELIVRIGLEQLPVSWLPLNSPITYPMPKLRHTFESPLNADAVRRILEDQALSRLFPGHTSEAVAVDSRGYVSFDVSSDLMFSAGGGGWMGATNIVESIINSAYLRCLIMNELVEPSEFVSQIIQAVGEVRALASGEVVDVPMFIFMSGIDLPSARSGGVVETASGSLISYGKRHHQLCREDLTGGIVFCTTFPLKLIGPRGIERDLEMDPKTIRMFSEATAESHRQIESRILKLQLGFVLGIQRLSEPPVAPIVQGHVVANPAFAPSIVRRLSPMPFQDRHELSLHEITEVNDWIEIVLREHRENLDTTVRRLIGAIGDRVDPVDGLVDAVVAWETLFSGRYETNLRVCCAIARCTSPDDYDERIKVERIANGLYDSRSALVHSGKPKKGRNAYDDRNLAIQLALKCLRWLYRERPDLIGLDSPVRSRLILLL